MVRVHDCPGRRRENGRPEKNIAFAVNSSMAEGKKGNTSCYFRVAHLVVCKEATKWAMNCFDEVLKNIT